ncbi:hypothetical protein [Azospirillum canadense]|uniref:hypothetical protein n=1 Tax=Azospirillum canadense TaxID=403962 RepID=UPI002225DF9B|nr:hypothetical protein [Azospirillum canadense]MCW2243582.1 hypothetical protein [Azospirillum canadense]
MPTLTVAPPVADRSLVDLRTVKAELGITDTASDALLARWIKEDSDAVCAACGVAPDQMGRRTFLAEAVTISYRADEVPGGYRPTPLILPWRLPLGSPPSLWTEPPFPWMRSNAGPWPACCGG